jgi:hypothetical protein
MIISLKTRNNILIILALLMFTATFAMAIVFQNMVLILAVAAMTMVFFVLRSNMVSFLILFFLAFFGNWLEDLHMLPPQISWLTEFIILLLLSKAIIVKVLRKKRFHLNFMGVFLFIMLFTWIAYQFHPTTYMHTFLFIRLLIRFYLLFLAIINLDLDEKFIRTTNKIFIFLFIIQIPTAVVKLFFYGIGESAIGTYAAHGGIPSVVIPLMAISFLAGYHFYYKPSMWYVIGALGFIAFGVIGGKRGLFLYLPVVILFIILNMRERIKKALVYLAVAVVIAILTGYVSIRVMPTLNPQHRVGGEVDLEFVKNYLTFYTMARYEGASGGRVITTIQIYEILKDEGLAALLFGIGPGSYIETRFEELKTTLVETQALPIVYGVTGVSWLALQIGYIGALVYTLLFVGIMIYAGRYFRSEKDPYWKAFGMGIGGFSFVMIIMILTYYPVFIDDLLPIVYFILAGFFMHKKIQRDNAELPEST